MNSNDELPTPKLNPQVSVVTASTVVVASLLSILLSCAGMWFVQKWSATNLDEPQIRIATLDTQKLVDAQIKSLLDDKTGQDAKSTESTRFSKDLARLIKQKTDEGFIILDKDAVMNSPLSVTDLTEEFARAIVTKLPAKVR